MNEPADQAPFENPLRIEEPEDSPISLTRRAIQAVFLMVGFYLLALVLVGVLTYAPMVLMAEGSRFPIKLLLFCWGGAAVIFWSILPRPDRFVPPGPVIEQDENPKLFKTLTGIAEATGQIMPAEVYLVPDMNAWVAQRGGVMGFGGRRVMGLGLPLLAVLDAAQLRAVLAHEFGHFYGGDTKLGPWVYKTRAAIGRTLQNLSKHSSLLQKPFEWYGNNFLRITHSVSRHQEFAADRLAAGVAGAQALTTGLKRIHQHAAPFRFYWFNEVMPVLESGFRPSVSEGFRSFIQSPRVDAAASQELSRELASGQTNPYDTHPSLRERIGALQKDLKSDAPGESEPALALFEDLDKMETDLLSFLSSEAETKKLKPVTWDKVGYSVWAPIWEKQAQSCRGALAGVTPAAFPDLFKNPHLFSKRLTEIDGLKIPPQEQVQVSEVILRRALGAALIRRGWEMRMKLGENSVFTKRDKTIDPDTLISKLLSGELTGDSWQDICRSLGIDGLDLGDLTPKETPGGNSEADSKEGH